MTLGWMRQPQQDTQNVEINVHAGDVLDDALAVRGPRIDAEGEMRSRYRHRPQSSKLQVVAAQAVVVLGA